MALMCFSTARFVSTSESAIAELLLPWAISASTSRSREVSSASGGLVSARPRADREIRRSWSRSPSHPVTPPRRRRRAARHRARAPSAGRRVAQTPDRAAPGHRRDRRARLSTTTPTSGLVSRSMAAARMPSSVSVGGIRMSVTTTSGRSESTAASSESRSTQVATTSTPGAFCEQLLETLAHDVAVFCQDDADRRATASSHTTLPH